MFQCINGFQNEQSLFLLWHNKLVYPPELSRILQDFVLILVKFFWGRTPNPPPPSIKQNRLGLYYNHNTANHLKKLQTHTKNPPPPTHHHFSGELKIKWSLYVLFEKSIVDHFFANGCLKEQRKVLENSLKMYLKSPWKVLEKGMSWSVGTMTMTWINYSLFKLCVLFNSDLNKVKEGIGDKFSFCLQYTAQFLSGFAIGFWKGWKMALVMMSLTPLLAICAGFFSVVI